MMDIRNLETPFLPHAHITTGEVGGFFFLSRVIS